MYEQNTYQYVGSYITTRYVPKLLKNWVLSTVDQSRENIARFTFFLISQSREIRNARFARLRWGPKCLFWKTKSVLLLKNYNKKCKKYFQTFLYSKTQLYAKIFMNKKNFKMFSLLRIQDFNTLLPLKFNLARSRNLARFTTSISHSREIPKTRDLVNCSCVCLTLNSLTSSVLFGALSGFHAPIAIQTL